MQRGFKSSNQIIEHAMSSNHLPKQISNHQASSQIMYSMPNILSQNVCRFYGVLP